MTKKTWIIFVVICAAILGGLIWMSKNNQVNVADVDINAIQSASEQNGNIADHVSGNKDAKVTIIEYGDFQCPGCKSAAPVMKTIKEKYKNDVAFVFRNFPLPIHGNARAAAAAAEAAGLQGKYWEMHDKLYESQNEWAELSGSTRLDTFAAYAGFLGLDRDKFLADIEKDEIATKINFDKALGTKAGVTGTPSIFVNGEHADQSVKDGKLVDGNNTDPLVWSSVELFEQYVLIPALKEAGVAVDDPATE
jgi:protein-disulfide isomerase